MDFRHLIVTCLFSMLRLSFETQKIKENYAILNMESAEYSLDELLCQSLLLFRQYRFYDAPECGEKAFRILEEAHVWMGRTQECVDMAKWGCVIECLAQKYYIEDDTDAILEEIDAALVVHRKR